MPKKILLVDDDWGVSNSLAIVLRGEGYYVDVTRDSTEATIFIKKNKYDAYLFDYKMEGYNGLDLLKMTKKVNSQCPVFIISGVLRLDEIFKETKDAGLVAGVISKPFDVEALLDRIADSVK